MEHDWVARNAPAPDLAPTEPSEVIVGSFCQSSLKAKQEVLESIKCGGPIIARSPIQVSAGLDFQPSHNNACFPCLTEDESSNCIRCVLTPHFSAQNNEDLQALVSHFGSLHDLRSRLESLKSEEREMWIRNKLIAAKTLGRRNPTMRSTNKCFSGLVNQGASCYMNSALQMLYHIPSFRKAVYQMETTVNGSPSESISLHLQTLFYELQYGAQTAVETKQFTYFFGWDKEQQDVHEFKLTLFQKLGDEEAFINEKIRWLFEGHYKTQISYATKEFTTEKDESFYDLQLDVRGCINVYASFDKYTELELTEHWAGEEYGLEYAWKHVSFNDFPPVLLLHLRRRDFSDGIGAKVNDRYEYPVVLDLDKDNGKSLSKEADRGVRNLYELQSVLVHSGHMLGGHYYVYVRPALSEKWLLFDDQYVEESEEKMAIGQFGGEKVDAKGANAYVLTYVRQSDKEHVFCDLGEEDLPRHLVARL